MHKGFKNQLLLVLVFFLLCQLFITPMRSFVSLSANQKVIVGENLCLDLDFPKLLLKKLSVHQENNKNIFKFDINAKDVNVPALLEPGSFDLQLKLFGLIPIKTINVDVFPEIKLTPAGQAIGIVLRTDGVLVVGYSAILNNNDLYNPAKDNGIQVGDSIVKINNQSVFTDEQVAEAIHETGEKGDELIFTMRRDERLYQVKLKPFFCQETNMYRIGLYIKDNAGGIGTLTFIDTVSKKYGALGHIISDSKVNKGLNIKNGQLVKSSIEGIYKGKKGDPGEKIGVFIDQRSLGSIDKNCAAGIFGTLNIQNLEQDFLAQPIPVGFNNQIKKGAAEILTVVEGQRVDSFQVVIEKVFLGRNDGKNMIIRITDPKLLKLTGGIIQGMSGSPIIQNNRLIGAVTHVFINDPTRGYGIFIEEMLHEADLVDNNLESLGA